MRVANTELFAGWFTFQKTCADAAFYAVEMGICREPVSVLGVGMWSCVALVFVAIMAVILSTRAGRTNAAAFGALCAFGWFAVAATAKQIPDWVMQAVGGIFLLAILVFAALVAIQLARENRRAAAVISAAYIIFVMALFFGFDRNIGDHWGEMLGLPMLALFIVGLIITPFFMLGKAISVFIRRRKTQG